jgi:hypothetical protein
MNQSEHANVKAQIDHLTSEFFRAVSFEAGEVPPYENIRALFIDAGLLVKNTGAQPEISGIDQFIEPRLAMARAGSLTRFREAELSESTQIFGSVAQRFSAYEKSGTMKGVAFEARGMISTQFIATPNGWRMTSMAWDDERAGLSIPE